MTKGKTILLFVGLFLALAIAATLKISKSKSPGSIEAGTFSVSTPRNINLEIFEHEKGWGYKIYLDSVLFISQETIPGLTGSNQFTSYDDAKQCGELVVKKLNGNQRFAISRYELDSMNISY